MSLSRPRSLALALSLSLSLSGPSINRSMPYQQRKGARQGARDHEKMIWECVGGMMLLQQAVLGHSSVIVLRSAKEKEARRLCHTGGGRVIVKNRWLFQEISDLFSVPLGSRADEKFENFGRWRLYMPLQRHSPNDLFYFSGRSGKLLRPIFTCIFPRKYPACQVENHALQPYVAECFAGSRYDM